MTGAGGGEVDPWEVAMITPLFAFCPHSLAYFLRCSQLSPTLHLNIVHGQVKHIQ